MTPKNIPLPMIFNRLINKGVNKISYLREVAKHKAKEAMLADRYSSSKYTFDQAYKDARSKGQKTFFWNGKYYNTDYEGSHGKQYKEDVASGKAQAWQQQYPGFTNPELRKEKQEEIDTYGITDEQTKNKTWRDRQLRKIPARGYNVNDAISSLLGEHHSYSQYDSPEELIEALRKKYPQFKDIPLTGGYFDSLHGKEIYLDQDVRDLKMPEGADEDLWIAFQNDVYTYDKFNRFRGSNAEIHRPELDYLLGWPTSKNQQWSENQFGNNVIISKYKTGNLPYYYTTPLIEHSFPFIPKDVLARGKRNREMWEQLDTLYSHLPHPNTDALPEKYEYDDFVKAYEKDERTWQTNKDYQRYKKALDERTKMIETMEDKAYNDSTYRKRWEDLGLSFWRGDWDISVPTLARSNITSRDLDTLEKAGMLNYLEQLPLTPGNYLAGTGNDDYYIHDDDYYKYKGKYSKWIDKYNPSKEDHNKYNKNTLNTSNFIYSEPSLGVYTYSVPKDSSYISVWDKFDIDPFGSGNDKPIIKVGRPFEYYTRFYPEGKTPNIDSLYTNFKIK